MSNRPEGEFHSALDPLLEGFPQEEPPADLQQRCLDALRQAAGQTAQRRPVDRFRYLQPLAVAAAVLMLVVGVANFRSVMPRGASEEPRPPRHESAETTTATAPTDPETGEAAGTRPEPTRPPDGYAAEKAMRSKTVTATDGVWSTDESERALNQERLHSGVIADKREGTYAFGTPVRSEPFEYAGGALRLGRGPAPDSAAFSDGVRTRYGVAQLPASAEAGVVGTVTETMPAAPAAPWADTSGERQREVYKRLEIEVDDVEQAHAKAAQIIDGAGGYVAQEDVYTDQSSGNEATLSARVPVDRLGDAVAKLRDLGRVVGLHGTAEDRTAEYYGRGQQVRDTSAEEERIIQQLAQEDSRTKRQALRARLQSLRSKLQSQKQTLKDLSLRTHYAILDLALTQRYGTAEYLGRVRSRAGLAMSWVLATALIWVPLLLLWWALRWRRGRRASERCETPGA